MVARRVVVWSVSPQKLRRFPLRRIATLMLGAATLAWFGALEAACRGEESQPRPNIVLIVADDLGYGDLGCYGCPDIRTPVLDRLAGEGLRFTNFYANAPECTPTRTALLTGRYQQRVGGLECAIGTGNVGRYDDAIRLAEQHDLGLPTSEPTIVGRLKGAGYEVVCLGKWHMGYEPKFFPRRHGFDYFFGPLGGGVDYFYHSEWDGVPMLYENEQPVRREGYLTDLITDAAVAFLRQRQANRPFLLYLPYTAPHTPLQRPDAKPAVARAESNWNEGDRATYAAVVERLDQGVGHVLAALDARGRSQDTLVIFTSDNGATKLGRNAPFSGTKGGLFEGGIRVPTIVRWPGVLPQGRVADRMAITFDLSASILRVAGQQPEPGSLDGRDILRAISDDVPEPSRTLFWRQRRGKLTWRAVREGSLKYLVRQKGLERDEFLFDLAADPAEKINLLASRPADAARLKKELADWEAEVRPRR